MIDDAQEPEESRDKRIARNLREIAVAVLAELCRGRMSEEEIHKRFLARRRRGRRA
jgi:hypothetical protein